MENKKEPLMSAFEWHNKNKKIYFSNYELANEYAKYFLKWHKRKKTDRTCNHNCSVVCGECQIMHINNQSTPQ
jgi:hypothetical protein